MFLKRNIVTLLLKIHQQRVHFNDYFTSKDDISQQFWTENRFQRYSFAITRALSFHAWTRTGGQYGISIDTLQINRWLTEVREFRNIQEGLEPFPLDNVFDVRASVARIRLEGTYMEEDELFDLKRSLETIIAVVKFLSVGEELPNGEIQHTYPALYALSDGVATFPILVQRISQIIDKFGKMRDSASSDLLQIRRELARVESSISRTLNSILHSAQNEGVVERDVTPTMRDGRLVIPVAPGMKRKISGIVHDESATGKNCFYRTYRSGGSQQQGARTGKRGT